MTKARFRRVAVFVGAATLAAGTGVSVSANTDDASAANGPTERSHLPAQPSPRNTTPPPKTTPTQPKPTKGV